jgi:hypothetical protein
MGSSPFSEESNSIRNSPKADIVDPKLPQEIDMGLRFGPNEEVWHDKTQKMGPPAEPTAASGPGPYFPGPLQVCINITHVQTLKRASTPVARYGSVRFLHGTVRYLHGTVRFLHGTVRFLHGTVRFLHGTVRFLHGTLC